MPATATGAVADVVDIAPATGNSVTVYPTRQAPPVATDVTGVPGDTYNGPPNNTGPTNIAVDLFGYAVAGG